VAAHIAKDQGVALDERHVLMTCGAGGALNVVLKTILNPGDQVVVSAPYFVEYDFYADNHGGSAVVADTKPDFNLDVAAIEKAITAKTAAVLINSPNNPSGRIYPEATIRALAAMLESASRRIGRTIYLLSDEPYRRIVYDGLRVPSALAAYRNAIACTSYSKDLSVSGERIGWLAVNPAADDVEDLLNGFTLCNRILGYVNAPALMQRAVTVLQDDCVDVAVYKKKRDALCDAISDIGYEFVKPQGTFYLFPMAPHNDDLAMVEALREQRILTVPGRGFGKPGYFRIAFCVEDVTIAGSIPGFRKAWEAMGEKRKLKSEEYRNPNTD
jgi:aspartate aminotransferase